MSNPRSINQDLVDAQQARRILDRLVGYKLSPFYPEAYAAAYQPAEYSLWQLN